MTTEPPSAPRYVLNKWSSLAELSDHYAWDDGLLRLDLGCGYVKPPLYVGLDNLIGEQAQVADEANAPDVLMDLNADRLPFADDSCWQIRGSHFLEHSSLTLVFDECHRLLAPGGIFHFLVPYANSAQGMFPGHTVFFTERFFHRDAQFQRQFRIVGEQYFASDAWWALPWLARRALPFHAARKHLYNVCHEMAIWATPRKRSGA